MTYATQQNMVDRFGEQELIDLTDRASAGVIDTDVLDAAIADASSDIDGYLAGRYQLPLDNVPKILERLCCDIARFYLYEDRLTEAVENRYKHAVSYLRDVGTGRLQLDLDANDETAANVGAPQHDAPDRVFTTDTLKDFV